MSFVDWKDEKEADEYLKTVNAEYSFSCYKEKDPEGKPAHFCLDKMQTFLN